jgi:hypothetical protein
MPKSLWVAVASTALLASCEPAVPSYTITDESRLGNVRCSFDVRVEARIPESSIRLIAQQIKRREARSCERTFIVYSLPEMDDESPAWATSHFTPRLSVQILGMQPVEDVPVLPSGHVIGRWQQVTMPAGWVTIFRRDGQLLARWDYTDGSSGERELEERPDPSGQVRFYERDNSFGEYYVIEADGRLGLFDDDGRIATLAPAA